MKEGFIDKIIESARANLEESGYLMPVFFIGNEQKTLVVGTPFRNEKEKDEVSTVVRKTAKEIGADFVVFVSEGWTLNPEDSDDFIAGLRSGKYKNLSEHPRKKEIVSFIIETKTEDLCGMSDIVTKENGIKTFGEVSIANNVDNRGRFSRFLGPKAVMH